MAPVSTAQLSSATPEEVEPLVKLLDQEFMLKRNRSGSVADHYPDIFRSAEGRNLLVLRTDGEPASFCALKEFTVHVEDAVLRGGMIGFVYTRPSQRGVGLATRLLLEAESLLKCNGCDFAVLFTTLHSFYQAQGWSICDTGCFGMVSQPASLPTGGVPSLVSLDSGEQDTIDLIETIRQRTERLWVERPPSAYQRRPLAVNRVSAILSASREAYALIGRTKDRAYLYELCGREAEFEAIWKTLLRFRREVAVNSHAVAQAIQWLSRQNGLELKEQKHALWKWFRQDRLPSKLTLEHIPFFDRI